MRKCINKVQMVLVVVLVICLNISLCAHAESFVLCDGFSYEDVTESTPLDIGADVTNFAENRYVRRQDLRLLNVKYVGFDDAVHDGQLVVAYEVKSPITGQVINIAREVLEIFKELFDHRYPIDRMSCFCFRNISGKKSLSWHAYGLAVDINYHQNPCLIMGKRGRILKTVPENLERYANRGLNEKGMIKVGDACYNAFIRRGWEWGGSWSSPKDYMHFQKFAWNAPRPAAKY